MSDVPQVEIAPAFTRTVNGGPQVVYRFSNGYGASVVRTSSSYGGAQGLWELAVVRFHGEDPDHFSPTSDVLGWLDDQGVAQRLAEIAALQPC